MRYRSIKRLKSIGRDRICSRRRDQGDTNNAYPAQAEFIYLPTNKAHTAVLVVGLMCLAFINLTFLAGHRRYPLSQQRFESGERMSGFGQSLRYFFSSFHCRDLITSITAVRRNVIQEGVYEGSSEAIHREPSMLHFREFVERGARPNPCSRV